MNSDRARGSHLRTLLWHRLQEHGSAGDLLAPDLADGTPASLDWKLQHLARFYHPIGADELLAAVDGRHRLPARAVLATFDDGYHDFVDVAWPLLKRHRIPAVFFVSTTYVDDPRQIFSWDALWQALARTVCRSVSLLDGRQMPLGSLGERIAARSTLGGQLHTLQPAARRQALEQIIERLGVRPEPTGAVVNWDDLRQLSGDGLTVAAHSRTHERLDQLDQTELRSEVAGSRDDIVRELGTCPPLFAYPYGSFNGLAAHELEVAGFRSGFTTRRGVSLLPGTDPRLLRREPGRADPGRFALRLLGPVAVTRAFLHLMPNYPRGVRAVTATSEGCRS